MVARGAKRMKKQPVSTLYIVGPTASGKTALAMKLAEELGAEIVCADSQTVRRAMDIGTAKPTKQEQERVPHHCLDIIDPYDESSLDDYLQTARAIIAEIQKRGKLAIVVGGTGLYVDGLYFQFSLPDLSADMLAQKEALNGLSVEALQAKIQSSNLMLPENAKNKRHLVNTLLRSGARGDQSAPSPHSLIVGLNPAREVLLERINARADNMIKAGFVNEVQKLLRDYGQPPRAFDAIAYRIMMRHVEGEITEEEAVELMKIADRQYAKRQLSWFKRNKDIVWFEDGITAYEHVRAQFL